MTSLDEAIDTHIGPCGGDCSTCSAAGSCPDRVVCRCLQVTEDAVIESIRVLGARTVKDIRAATGAGGGCMCCQRELKTYLTIYSSSSPIMCSAR